LPIWRLKKKKKRKRKKQKGKKKSKFQSKPNELAQSQKERGKQVGKGYSGNKTIWSRAF
jgi:hypothetical protein